MRPPLRGVLKPTLLVGQVWKNKIAVETYVEVVHLIFRALFSIKGGTTVEENTPPSRGVYEVRCT